MLVKCIKPVLSILFKVLFYFNKFSYSLLFCQKYRGPYLDDPVGVGLELLFGLNHKVPGKELVVIKVLDREEVGRRDSLVNPTTLPNDVNLYGYQVLYKIITQMSFMI